MGTRSKPSKRTPSKSETLVPFAPAGFYPYTKAAREIADLVGESEGLRRHWTEKMLRAILGGELPSYDQKGGLLGVDTAKAATVLHIVAKDDVNAWLKSSNPDSKWIPIQASSGSLSTTLDLRVLVTPDELVGAFGARTGMNIGWFDSLRGRPALKAARKVLGRGGLGGFPPLYCPYEVMNWLCKGRTRGRRKLSEEVGWGILERCFPNAYEQRSHADIRNF